MENEPGNTLEFRSGLGEDFERNGESLGLSSKGGFMGRDGLKNYRAMGVKEVDDFSTLMNEDRASFGDLLSTRTDDWLARRSSPYVTSTGKSELSRSVAKDGIYAKNKLATAAGNSQWQLEKLEISIEISKLKQEHGKKVNELMRQLGRSKQAMENQTSQFESISNSQRQRIDKLKQSERHLSGKLEDAGSQLRDVTASVMRLKNENVVKIAGYERNLAKKNEDIIRLHREIEQKENECDSERADNRELKATIAYKDRQNEALTAENVSLAERMQNLVFALDDAKARQKELEESLDKERLERDRAENIATRERMSAEKAMVEVSKYKLQCAMLNEEFRNQTLLLTAPGSVRKLTNSKSPLQNDSNDLIDISAGTLAGEDVTRMKNDLEKTQNLLREARDELKKRMDIIRELRSENHKLVKNQAQEESDVAVEAVSNDKSVKDDSHDFRMLEISASRAEWDRHEMEKELFRVQKESLKLEDGLEEQQKLRNVAENKARNLRTKLESIEATNVELTKELENLRTQLSKVEVEMKPKPQGFDRYKAVVSHLAMCVERLVAVIETFLNGEEPPVSMLLSGFEMPSEKLFSTEDKLFNEAEGDSMDKTISGIESIINQVLALRSRIADHYAKRLGQDCNVQ